MTLYHYAVSGEFIPNENTVLICANLITNWCT